MRRYRLDFGLFRLSGRRDNRRGSPLRRGTLQQAEGIVDLFVKRWGIGSKRQNWNFCFVSPFKPFGRGYPVVELAVHEHLLRHGYGQNGRFGNSRRRHGQKKQSKFFHKSNSFRARDRTGKPRSQMVEMPSERPFPVSDGICIRRD
ncbi:hypothetical protein NLA_8080 [Neisseria lactamica 020-06]|uniref:Uncharacterized protein n=1 Tax=Neisseria lactamica (strain 020-06) TaxID=489653 RepID=E4ZCG3_NEIL0|nr:hypothetical protein NLA_8080 [Neisseria lactamica 020-06]